MGITIFTSDILIIECLTHELRDTRESLIRETIFTDLVGMFDSDHIQEDLLILIGSGFDDFPFLEPELDTRDERRMIVERLIESDPSLCPSPVGRDEEFK